MFLIYSILVSAPVYGQSTKIDSLKSELNNSEEDTTRVNILNKLAFRYYNNSYDTSQFYARQALNLAHKLNFTRGIISSYNSLGIAAHAVSEYDIALKHYELMLAMAREDDYLTAVNVALNNIGIIHRIHGNYPKALLYYNQSLEVKRTLKDTIGEAKTINNIGLVYESLGEYSTALDYYIRALKIKENYDDTDALASTCSNIGNIKSILGQYEEAMRYFDRAISYYRQSNNTRGIGNIYTRMGDLLKTSGQNNEALDYYEKGLEIYTKLGSRYGIGSLYKSIGAIYMNKKNYATATKYLINSLNITTEIDNKRGIAQSNLDLAKCYMLQKKYSKAIKHGQHGLLLAKQIGAKKEIADAAEILYKTNRNIGDYTKAFDNLLIFNAYNDSLLNELKLEEIGNIESRYELEKLEKQNEVLSKENLLSENELKRSQLQIQKQRILLVALIAGLVFSILLAILWYRYNKQKKRTIKILQELNTEINVQKEQISNQAQDLIKANDQIKQINGSLEKIIEQRTEKIRIQGEKIKEYAFSNSHVVRAPLSNILGLADLFKTNNLNKNEIKELSEKVYVSAKQLDKVLKELNTELEKEY